MDIDIRFVACSQGRIGILWRLRKQPAERSGYFLFCDERFGAFVGCVFHAPKFLEPKWFSDGPIER